jgi:hypothetical protein
MSDPQRVQHLAILAGPPKLNHEELMAAQKETLDAPRRPPAYCLTPSTRYTGGNVRWASSRFLN